MSQQASDRREFPAKSWKPMNGPFFGQWRQAPHIWNMTSAQSDLQQRLSFEFDRPNCIEKLTPGGRYSIAGHDKKYVNVSDRTNSSNNNISREKLANGKSGLDATSTFSSFRGEEGNAEGTLDSCRLEENESASTRKAANPEPYSTNSSGANLDAHLHSHVSSFPSTTSREDSSSLLVGLAASFQSASGSKEPTRFSANQSPCQAGPPPSKPFYHQSIMEADLQPQIRNGKSRVDNRVRAHLLPRYWPRITDKELQQISGEYPFIFIYLILLKFICFSGSIS